MTGCIADYLVLMLCQSDVQHACWTWDFDVASSLVRDTWFIQNSQRQKLVLHHGVPHLGLIWASLYFPRMLCLSKMLGAGLIFW